MPVMNVVTMTTGGEKYRFAVTADVVIHEGTILQFDLAMGCSDPKQCFSKFLSYF